MKNKKTTRRVLLAVVVVAALSAAGYGLYRSGWIQKINSVEALRELIDKAGPMAGILYFLLQMLTVIVAPIPSNISMMAGALALGFWEAMILGMLAVIAGSIVVFLAARALGRNAVQRYLDKSVMEKYLPVIEEKQDMFLFLTMLFPFFPDDALCILAGLTTISLGRFVCIMAFARPWGLAFAALLGSGVINMPLWGWALIAVPLAAIFILALKYSSQIEERLFRFVGRISKSRRPKGEDVKPKGGGRDGDEGGHGRGRSGKRGGAA